jgi:peptide/nickel transport system ATP-binding protein
MLLQDPFTMLNPVMRCGAHIEEMLRDRPEFRSRAARKAEVQRRLTEVGITDPAVASKLPSQLSGGMCQRVALATALARDPELLIADEPSTALDVTTQAEIMKLLQRAQRERGMALILITHDLRLAFSACEQVCVFYAGSQVEIGTAAEIGALPAHPYTTGLLLSEPPPGRRLKQLVAIRGRVPPAHTVESQCAFADRCDWARPECRASRPALEPRANGRLTACLRQPEIQGELQALHNAVLGDVSEAITLRDDDNPLVRVDNITKTFGALSALKGVSLRVRRGESVGLVGESGSGKTTLGRCLVGLETPSTGDLVIDGIDAHDYEKVQRDDRARLRRTVQMVFQDPYSTLNPRHSIRRILLESLRAAGRLDGADAEIERMLIEVGLTPQYAARRPAQLSGGERQRIAIARALAVDPQLLVCDEPVSALDVSVQAQVLNLLKHLQQSRGLSFLFITHDLAVVRQIADWVCVLYLGNIVEQGPADEILDHPQHPYTQRLLGSIPGNTDAVAH